MHAHGVLDRYIPEFGQIRHLVIHEPYHKYTVDEHTLLTIKALENLNDPKNSADKYLSEIFTTFKEKEIIYLALLFHDIGKAKGKMHTVEGYKYLLSILDRFSLDHKQRNIIEFIVENHIVMAVYAFSKDFRDPDIIARFADIVKDYSLLNALYLITFADMSAVNPDFCTPWRKSLLSNLYHTTVKYLKGVYEEPEKYIKASLDGNVKPDILAYIHSMPKIYLLSSSLKKIERDFSLAKDIAMNGFAFHLDCNKEDLCEITVAAYDRAGLLSNIVSVLSARKLNIISLRTFQSSDGFVIDRFGISNYKSLWWSGMDEMIKGELQEAALNDKEFDLKSYSAKKSRFCPMLIIDNETSSSYTVFETLTGDRIGLLCDITGIFSKAGLNISLARVNTESDVAQDVFYVSKDAKALPFETTIKVINQLMEVIT
ncbi:[Protein-PII] uridylyltransferase [Candidatus Magnetoovum chiemensis]|nr:[Protein-PII] uridylyltransferase [Candidatus Magnetoovum chiemensis]